MVARIRTTPKRRAGEGYCSGRHGRNRSARDSGQMHRSVMVEFSSSPHLTLIPRSRPISLTSDKQAYITSRLNDAQRSGTYLMHLLKYALSHLPHSWTLLYRVIERLKGVRQRLKFGCLRMNIANRFLKGQVRTLPRVLCPVD